MGFWYWLARTGFAGPMVSGMEIDAVGVEHLPPSGAVLVCNHACEDDPGVLMRALPGTLGFLGAPFMDRLPVFRTLLRWSGSVAIQAEKPKPWREQVRDRLHSGARFVVFPEGQRWLLAQQFDAPMAEFYAGFAAFAYEARVPVVPMVIVGHEVEILPFKASPLLRRFSDNAAEIEQITETMRYRRCTVQVLEPIAAELFVDKAKGDAVPWLMEEARGRMERALEVSGPTSSR